MSQHPIGGHVMPGENAAAECRHCRNMPPGKIGIAVLVPRIGDLYANGARVDVGISRPGRNSGMPRSPQLRDELDDAPVLQHPAVFRSLFDHPIDADKIVFGIEIPRTSAVFRLSENSIRVWGKSGESALKFNSGRSA